MKTALFGVAALAATLFTLNAQAASQANVWRVWNDTVAPAQQQAYEAGIKTFNQCLRQHGFKYGVGAFTQSTGNTYQYAYVIGPVTWADFDVNHAFTACNATYSAAVDPHLQSETSGYLTLAAGMYHLSGTPAALAAPGALALLDVNQFTLKPSQGAGDTFVKSVKEIYTAMEKARWPHYSETFAIVAAGPGAADYELVGFDDNWAQFGADENSSLMSMLDTAYGKKKAGDIMKSVNSVIASAEESVYRADPALTYTPAN
ncbi:MAG: hypothetical protein ACRETQ_02975 [Gammaproteobacteria bacterium]